MEGWKLLIMVARENMHAASVGNLVVYGMPGRKPSKTKINCKNFNLKSSHIMYFSCHPAINGTFSAPVKSNTLGSKKTKKLSLLFYSQLKIKM